MSFLATIVAFVLLCACVALQEPARVPGISGVVARGTQIELVKEGFEFTEGPVGARDGGLYFSDTRATPSKIYRLRPSGEIVLFRDNANASNGLAFDRDGSLLAAEGDGRRIVRLDAQGSASIATEGSADQSILRPNDLIVDAKGGVDFTDPGPRPVVAGRKAYVWYLPPAGKQAVVVDDQIVRPTA